MWIAYKNSVQNLLISLVNVKAIYKFTYGGEYLGSSKKFPFHEFDPVICGTDKMNQVLVADFTEGSMYLFKPLSDGIQMSAILSSVQTPETRSVVIDRNNNVWVLAGNDDYKLFKFVSQQ